MTKKILVLSLGLVLVFAGLAYAGIEGSAHDPNVAGFTQLADGGKCSACHIPHGALGSSRLWPVSVASVPGVFKGEVAVLCGYCHYGAGGASLPSAASDSASTSRRRLTPCRPRPPTARAGCCRSRRTRIR